MARNINDRQPDYVLSILEKCLEGINNPTVTIMGVAYKGNIEDTRESPALKVLDGLGKLNIKFEIFDPHVSNFKYITKSLTEAFKGSDCGIVLADHDEFGLLDPKQLVPLMRNRIIIDTRNCLDKKLWQENGFKFFLLGEGKVT